MSSEFAIRVMEVSKRYEVYEQPRDRLKQFIYPRLQRLTGRVQRQYFNEFWALRDVSFEVMKGQTVGIIGRNGSGKSTLLQAICGTLTPTMGTIEVFGRVAALLELGAGFNPEFSGRENVYLNASILGLSKEEIDARYCDIVNFADIGDFIEKPVKTYSSGMYVRLAFAVIAHVDADILIIDEALAVGDMRFTAKCMRRIRDIQDNGASILFVSHDVSSVRTLCDRALWIDKGELIKYGSVFHVTGQYTEFMLKDDDGVDCRLFEEENISSEETYELEGITFSSHGAQNIISESDHMIENVDAKHEKCPISHWGSHVGMIRRAFIRDCNGEHKDVFIWGEAIEIVIDVIVPKSISRENLIVAFSIKDLKGTDLIVSTTRDQEKKILPHDEGFSVIFQMENWLVTGKYLLVAAVERRQNCDVHYYEYFEGAQYFSSHTDNVFFGIIQPRIKQKIRVNKK